MTKIQKISITKSLFCVARVALSVFAESSLRFPVVFLSPHVNTFESHPLETAQSLHPALHIDQIFFMPDYPCCRPLATKTTPENKKIVGKKSTPSNEFFNHCRSKLCNYEICHETRRKCVFALSESRDLPSKKILLKTFGECLMERRGRGGFV